MLGNLKVAEIATHLNWAAKNNDGIDNLLSTIEAQLPENNHLYDKNFNLQDKGDLKDMADRMMLEDTSINDEGNNFFAAPNL